MTILKNILNSFKSPHWPPLVALVVRLQSPEMIQGCWLHPDHSETLLEFTFTWYLNSGYSWIFYDILTWNWFYNWTTTNWHESWHIHDIFMIQLIQFSQAFIRKLKNSQPATADPSARSCDWCGHRSPHGHASNGQHRSTIVDILHRWLINIVRIGWSIWINMVDDGDGDLIMQQINQAHFLCIVPYSSMTWLIDVDNLFSVRVRLSTELTIKNTWWWPYSCCVFYNPMSIQKLENPSARLSGIHHKSSQFAFILKKHVKTNRKNTNWLPMPGDANCLDMSWLFLIAGSIRFHWLCNFHPKLSWSPLLAMRNSSSKAWSLSAYESGR